MTTTGTSASARARGKLLVVGGGVAGISAAVEAAEAGCEVVLVEREPQLGGRVAQMYQYFPKLCPPSCGLEINLRRIRTGRRIEVHTLTTVEEVAGVPGKLQVTLAEKPRFIAGQCSACGTCAAVCPVERSSRFDFGLGKTKAAYLAHPGAWPTRYTVDAETCVGAACAKCVPACPCHAIDLSMQPRELRIEVSAVIWTTGWQPYEASRLTDLGFGAHPDVITNMMMERLASPHGPTAGRIECPSNHLAPGSVAFVQCAGSRDDAHLPYCSGLCCTASVKQVRYLRAQCPDAEIFVFYIDRRVLGRHEGFLAETEREPKAHLVAGKVSRVSVEGGKPVLDVEDMGQGKRLRKSVDLVVLATGVVPSAAGQMQRDRYGFSSPAQTAAGQFVAGCAREPMDVASAVRDANSAVLRALAFCRAGGG